MKVFRRIRSFAQIALAVAITIVGPTAARTQTKTSNNAALAKAAALVDLNTATSAELENVPGIGPAYAKKIISHRPYASVKDLSKAGIPAANLAKIMPLVTVKVKKLVDVNTATSAELEAVYGVGPSYAKKIIAHRPYATVKDLSKAGIPAGDLAKIIPLVTVKVKKPVDINTATLAELEEVPGVGSAYAKRIIAHRPYATVNDLSKSGIPAARLEKIVPLVTVKSKKTAVSESNADATPAEASDSTAAADTTPPAKTRSRTRGPETTDKAPATPPEKGMVWVNTESKVYHVEGDHWYGKTKHGKWMTEDDAIKAGYRKAK